MASRGLLPFTHTPLESPSRMIRLLQAEATSNGTYEYFLHNYILDSKDTPHFCALSHEWGPAQPTFPIAINKKEFRVRQNLWGFLQRFESGGEDFTHPLWVDAICIDQNSVSERNEQVPIMSQIFSAASLVLAWLKPQPIENGGLGEVEVILREWETTEEYSQLCAQEPRQMPGILSLRNPYGVMWHRLQKFCESGHFHRAWLVSELIKAEGLVFLWGKEQISWQALSVAFTTIHEAKRCHQSFMTISGPWNSIEASMPYMIWQHSQGLLDKVRLLETMDIYREYKTSVSRDKAYALADISSDSKILQTDHDKPFPELYSDLISQQPNDADLSGPPSDRRSDVVGSRLQPKLSDSPQVIDETIKSDTELDDEDASTGQVSLQDVREMLEDTSDHGEVSDMSGTRVPSLTEGESARTLSDVPDLYIEEQLAHSDETLTNMWKDDDIASVISIEDKIQDVTKVVPERSSRVLAAEYHLSRVFADHDAFTNVCKLGLARVPHERFLNNLKRLLGLFYLDISSEAVSEAEKRCADFIKYRTVRKRISDLFVRHTSTMEDEPDIPVSSRMESRTSLLEDWLGKLEIRPDEIPDRSTLQSSEKEPQLPAPGISTAQASTSTPNIEAMRDFLYNSTAFQQLLYNTQMFLTPVRLAPLCRVLTSLPREQISFDNPTPYSNIDRFKRALEACTGSEWDWWPFKPPMNPLARSRVRIHWHCHCNEVLSEDVAPDDAQFIKDLLDARGVKSSHSDHVCCDAPPEQRRCIAYNSNAITLSRRLCLGLLTLWLIMRNDSVLALTTISVIGAAIILTSSCPLGPVLKALETSVLTFLDLELVSQWPTMRKHEFALCIAGLILCAAIGSTFSDGSFNHKKSNTAPAYQKPGGPVADLAPTRPNCRMDFGYAGLDIIPGSMFDHKNRPGSSGQSNSENPPSTRDSTETPSNRTRPAETSAWILLGVGGHIELFDVDHVDARASRMTNDYKLFTALKLSHARLKGYIRRTLSVWCLSHCEIVKFTNPEAFHIFRDEKGPNLPTNQFLHDYEFESKGAPLTLHEFRAGFSPCRRGCLLSFLHRCVRRRLGRRVLVRVPKKRSWWSTEIDCEPEEAWGLCACEAPSALRVTAYQVVILLGPFAFWLWWLIGVDDRDWQSASIPAAVVISLQALFWTQLGVLRLFTTRG